MSGLSDLFGNVSGSFFFLGAPAFLVLAYFFLVWDARRPDSASKDDGQIGVKVVLYFLVIIGVGFAAGGTGLLLNYLLSGTKAGTPVLKQALAGVISGVIPIFAVGVILLPRTNFRQYTRAARLAYGYLAALGCFMALQSLQGLIGQLIMSQPWAVTSGQLANLIVFGGIGFFSLFRLGSLSGWSAPVRPMPMAPSQGYPPQGGGYPPGYPPQGYPQGYGGGYQQGGGGYPPGGGYQPR